MVLENDQTEILELMAKNEEKIQELYKIYSEKFLEYLDFWSHIANDERMHALWLRSFKNAVLSGKSVIDNDRFNKFVVQEFTKYLDIKINEIENSKILLNQALIIASDIEKSLLESEFFKVIKNDSEELKHLLSSLSSETKKHFDKIEKLKGQLGSSAN